jgi:hypothetical protein
MQVEHVEPIRPLRPPRRSRARSLAAALVPIGLLIVVAGAGVLGRTDDARTVVAPDPTASAPPVERPAPSTPVVVEAAAEPAFPRTAIGIPVRSVADTLERLRTRAIDQELVAVAGFLTVPPNHVACEGLAAATGTPNLLCRRGTMLLDTSEPLMGVRGDEVVRLRPPGVHLHPQALPGTTLRPLRQRAAGWDPLRPIPVVLIGRFGDPRLPDCRPAQRHCGESFAIERIIWVDGAWKDRQSERAPGVDRGRLPARLSRLITQDSIRDSSVVLSETLLGPEHLALVDPDAATRVDADADGPFWYVRLVVRRSTTDGALLREVGWAVVDDPSGRILAAEPPRRSRLGP